MTAFLQNDPQLACFVLAATFGVVGGLALLVLKSKAAAIASWGFGAFWFLAGAASAAGLGKLYSDYVAYLLVASVVIAGIVLLVRRLRA